MYRLGTAPPKKPSVNICCVILPLIIGSRKYENETHAMERDSRNIFSSNFILENLPCSVSEIKTKQASKQQQQQQQW